MKKYKLPLDLLIGIISFYSIILSRYGFNDTILSIHEKPFFVIILLILLANYIVGLYDRNLGNLTNIANKIFVSNLSIFIISIFIFYIFPDIIISPKTNLVLFLATNGLIVYGYHYYLTIKGRFKKYVYINGEGEDYNDLINHLKNEKDFYFEYKGNIDFDNIDNYSHLKNKAVFVIDTNSEIVKQNKTKISEQVYKGFEYIELKQFFEDTMQRIPLQMIDEMWFITYMQRKSKTTYVFFKRAFDIFCALLLLPTFLLFPIVMLAMYIEDGRKYKSKFLIKQNRVGILGKIINIPKIRSRRYDDPGVAFGAKDNPVTFIGRILRPSRIDELPQLFSVFRGDISLIGPRPEIDHITEELSKVIPFFKMRTLVQPGLSGWAQVNQDYVPKDLYETKLKLSYDLYYIKHRSISLEVKIMLKTIRTILSRFGS